MSRYHPEISVEPIVQAVSTWKEAAFRQQKSLFLPDTPVWTLENISELVEFIIENPDESGNTFWVKLEKQLVPASMPAKVLFAEILWLMYLFPRENIKLETKRENIKTVLRWAGLVNNYPDQYLPALEVSGGFSITSGGK